MLGFPLSNQDSPCDMYSCDVYSLVLSLSSFIYKHEVKLQQMY